MIKFPLSFLHFDGHIYGFYFTGIVWDAQSVINPRRACAARVTVLGLCVCVCVCIWGEERERRVLGIKWLLSMVTCIGI